MFLGSYTPSFDLNSRRIALPIKLREYLATSEIVLSKGFEKCIFGFNRQGWEKESKKQLDQSLSDRKARGIRRFFFSGASINHLDNQGRFIIPISLCKWAQIKKPIIVGAGDHLEIWDNDLWIKEEKKLERATK